MIGDRVRSRGRHVRRSFIMANGKGKPGALRRVSGEGVAGGVWGVSEEEGRRRADLRELDAYGECWRKSAARARVKKISMPGSSSRSCSSVRTPSRF